MKQRIILSLGIIFIAVGLVAGYQPFMNWLDRNNPVVKPGPSVTFKVEPSKTKAQELITGKPVKIEVPSVGITLPVVEGFYNAKNNTWSLSLDKAHYATIAPEPNNKAGNTFIYAHNRKNVFINLPKVQIGAEAIVTTANNHKFTYKLSGVKTTKPTDTSIFDYKGAPILTLQTCTGAWYQDRTLFSFQLVGVS